MGRNLRLTSDMTIGALLRAMFPNGTDYRLTFDPQSAGTEHEADANIVDPSTPLLRLLPLQQIAARYGVDDEPDIVEFENRLWQTPYRMRVCAPCCRPRRVTASAPPHWPRSATAEAPSLDAHRCRRTFLRPPVCCLDLSGASHHVVGTMGADETEPPGRNSQLQIHVQGPPASYRRSTTVAARMADTGAGQTRIPVRHSRRGTAKLETTAILLERKHIRAAADYVTEMGRNAPVFRWWHEALFLFETADEALNNVGFPGVERTRTGRINVDPDRGKGDSYPLLERYYDLLLAYGRKSTRAAPQITSFSKRDALFSISTVSPDIACVLPKSRTAQVGCTLRSLSHNVAILPSQGRARAQWWMFSPQGRKGTYKDDARFPLHSDSQPLNLLLIPYPYEIPNGSIVASHFNSDESQQGYGWFRVRPEWAGKTDTPEVICRLAEELAQKGRDASGPIHGIVFPELALSFRAFSHLVNRIKSHTHPNDIFSDIDFLVAGLRDDQTDRRGNFAGACIFSGRSRKRKTVRFSRARNFFGTSGNTIAGGSTGARSNPTASSRGCRPACCGGRTSNSSAEVSTCSSFATVRRSRRSSAKTWHGLNPFTNWCAPSDPI